MGYPSNCWYMASWAHDLAPGQVLALSIADHALAIYRSEAGRVAALEDRCPHKLAPLSMGQVQGDNLRCMYHGLLFSADGVCLEVPGQDTVPRTVCARSFPAAEAHSAVWVWIGDPAVADTALIPPFVGVHAEGWRLLAGQTDYEANYHLIVENLLDLSHVVFVHRNSFGAGRKVAADPGKRISMVRGELETLPRGVRQTRVLPSAPMQPDLVPIVGETADLWSRTDFLVPGVFLMWSDVFPEGEIARAGGRRPPDEALIHRTFTCQAVTAMGPRASRYFFAAGPWALSALPARGFLDVAARAFEEDRVMINAQQQVIDRSPDSKPRLLAMDQLGGLYRVVERQFLDS